MCGSRRLGHLDLYEKSRRILEGFIEKIDRNTRGIRKYVPGKLESVISVMLIAVVVFSFSGAILALTYPLPAGVMFVGRNFSYQALPETILYVILIALGFLGTYLMDKAIRAVKPDAILFSIGTLILVCTLFAFIYIVMYVKGYPLWPPRL